MELTMKQFKLIFVLAAVMGLAACQSKVEYGDATEVETVNENFGSTDLQAIAAKMVDSMMTFPPIVAMTANSRPILFASRTKPQSILILSLLLTLSATNYCAQASSVLST